MMMPSGKTPLVTVITVTYNSAKYVRDAIESVLHQNYEDIEYIIGDDHSTDDTWDIIGTYKDDRIRAYRNPSNMREYPNRNKALSMASGKYVVFIDGDDMIYPHGLMYMVTMLEAFPDSALAIVGYECNHIIYPMEITPEEIYKFQFFGRGFLSSSMVGNLFRTSVLKDLGGFPTNLVFGDYYIRLKICQRYNCLIINGNPVWARDTPGQASSYVFTTKGYIETLTLNREFIGSPDCPLNPSDQEKALRNIFRPTARKIVKSLLKLKWQDAGMIMRSLGWKLSDVNSYLFSPQDFSYKNKYNSTHLLRMDLSKNPFSKNHKSIGNGSSK